MSEVHRGNLYSYDPMDLGIIGGLVLPIDDERGPFDTEIDERHPLYDRSMFDAERVLDIPFVNNVDTYGVKTPVRVKKYKGVPIVALGRRRVRAARLVNLRRAARGEPPIRVDVVYETSSDEIHLMGAMDGENRARADVGFASTMASIHRYLDRGVGTASIADTFNMPEVQLKNYLRFEGDSIDELRTLVELGTMSISAGMEIMRAGDHDAQRTALARVLGHGDEHDPRPLQTLIDDANSSGKKVATRNARDAAKSVTRPSAATGVPDKRTQTKLLDALRAMSHGKASEKTIAFWEGAENMLMLIIGDDEGKEADKRLIEVIKEVRKAKAKSK